MTLSCAKCGKEVASEDVYVVNGQNLCEGCAIGSSSQKSPSKPCGPGSGT
ncbi:MAG: hypothetical protein ACOX4H_12330 [Bacillota bacterium]|jgi:formylmethanofuran dehydrogenase subunit E|nr:hypothetical protein [Clostridia bacterium]